MRLLLFRRNGSRHKRLGPRWPMC
ncbi:hypothetical protein [Edwardsiella tarda]